MNKIQKEFLDSLIGLEGDATTFLADSSIEMGTLVLYLERAVSQPCDQFLKFIDKLYKKDSTENLEIIRYLKFINDICFNNEVKYGAHGIKLALNHWFGSLGKIDPSSYEQETKQYINNFNKAMIEKEKQKLVAEQSLSAELADRLVNDKLTSQKRAREEAETNIFPDCSWRAKLDLPISQLANNYQSTQATTNQSRSFFSTQASLAQPSGFRQLTADEQIRLAIMSSVKLEMIQKPLLQREYMWKAFDLLKSRGLTKDHLITWEHLSNRYFTDQYLFLIEHVQALVFLIRDRNVEPAIAISELIKLSAPQSNAIISLYDLGLRGCHLRSWRGNIYSSFTNEHTNTLIGLVKELNFSPIAAIQEINKLNLQQTLTLRALYGYGLRGDHLRDWNLEIGNGREFTEVDHKALIYLITKLKLEPLVAIHEIKHLEENAIKTLQDLYKHGMRNEHLQFWRQKSPHILFTLAHKKTLTALMEKNNLSARQAIDEIIGLNEDQVQVLREQYVWELRGDHLRAWKSSASVPHFRSAHANALIQLMKDGLEPDAAISEINNLTINQVESIVTDIKCKKFGTI